MLIFQHNKLFSLSILLYVLYVHYALNRMKHFEKYSINILKMFKCILENEYIIYKLIALKKIFLIILVTVNLNLDWRRRMAFCIFFYFKIEKKIHKLNELFRKYSNFRRSSSNLTAYYSYIILILKPINIYKGKIVFNLSLVYAIISRSPFWISLDNYCFPRFPF